MNNTTANKHLAKAITYLEDAALELDKELDSPHRNIRLEALLTQVAGCVRDLHNAHHLIDSLPDRWQRAS